MKTLHIIRHGKSSWDLLGVADIDRPLIVKGVANNYLMAERLIEKYPKPDLIISSPANRAIHTALIFARVINLGTERIRIVRKIYESEVNTLFDVVEEVEPSINSIAIVGHNPTFTDFANHFRSIPIDNIPTSGIVTFQFDIKNWDIKHKTPTTSDFDFPKKE